MQGDQNRYRPISVMFTESDTTDLNTTLGMRTNPTISMEDRKLRTTKNRRKRKYDWTPSPKFPAVPLMEETDILREGKQCDQYIQIVFGFAVSEVLINV